MAYRTYDHRLKRLIAESKDPNLFPELNIPRTTTLNWISKGVSDVVTIPELESPPDELILQKKLKKQIEEFEHKHVLLQSTRNVNDLPQTRLERARNLGLKFSPTLISDSGSENVNHSVKSIRSQFEDHFLAQVDIDFSNSMVEAFFRKLKNSHLYFKELISIADAQKQVEFYVE